MTITEALRITHSVPRDARPFAVSLACGFTPLHLETFLAAHLQQALPGRKVNLTHGLYGNLAGTLEALANAAPADGIVVVLEWSDLDPRLDYRNAGSWNASDIVASARINLQRMAAALAQIPAGPRVALALPSLPLPPLFHTPGWLSSEHELRLHADVAHTVAEIAHAGRVSLINMQRLAEVSPAAERLDLKSDLYTGLPYTLQHADRLASLLGQALVPATLKKGIISDLDDTLWSGIVGEVGPDAVTWDLESRAQLHGLYQKLLASLAEGGTLIGIASKNDPPVVAEAFKRKDLLLRPDQVFPIEVHWNAKSGSVTRILETWNIAADSVIFVDDSPMELAEVAAAHPGIECVLFPKNDYPAALGMLRLLRDRCGKEKLSADDALRLASIRQGAAFREQASTGSAPESFLQQLDATVTIDFAAAEKPRVLELVNKTNQFNLNGRRYSEAEWQALLEQTGAVVAAINYEDKFGPLGTIAVICGRQERECLRVEAWVMSCRAFARRIEHQTLKTIFETTGVSEMQFELAATARNAPLREFFTALLGTEPQSACRLTRQEFEANCPTLYHNVHELRRAEAHG